MLSTLGQLVCPVQPAVSATLLGQNELLVTVDSELGLLAIQQRGGQRRTERREKV